MWAKPLLLAAFAAATLSAAPVDAIPRAPLAGAEQLFTPIQHRQVRPLREIVSELRAQYGGEYLGHREVEQGGRLIYVIQWRMPDGVTVRTFRVDAGRTR